MLRTPEEQIEIEKSVERWKVDSERGLLKIKQMIESGEYTYGKIKNS